MKATIFIGSLKKESNSSNTVELAKLVKSELDAWGVEVKLRYLRNRKMAHGVDFDSGEPDDRASVYFQDISDSDIVLFATPIWWGIQSSLISQLMERVGAYDDAYIEAGKTPLYGKVFGSIITASNDGFQHVIGNLSAFATNLGFTVPPEAYITWGTYLGQENNPVENSETMSQVKNASRNLYLWAYALKRLDLGNLAQTIEPGKIGLDSNDQLQGS